MENTLYIIRGLPGSGKSTFANTLTSTLVTAGIPVLGPFEADQYFIDPQTGSYNFDASKLGAAHNQCFANVENAMQRFITNVIVSNTFTTQKELKPYLELAKQYNYKVVSLVVENRHGNSSVHNVPDEAITRMKDRFTLRLTPDE